MPAVGAAAQPSRKSATPPYTAASGAKPRAYSYVRFSTPEQAAGDSYRRQTEQATAYAKKHGLELDTKLTFQDLGVSAFRGGNAEAGRLGAFLEAVRAGQVERGSWLIVESLDRLSRMTPRRASRVLENIIDEGITVVTMTDGKVYTSENIDADQITFLLAILTFMRAHEESATKGRRVRAAWDAKRTRTRAPKIDAPYTRRAPAWLKWNDKDRRWQLVSDRAKVLKRIFTMAKGGAGQHTIAAKLNAEGIAPWGRAKHWGRTYIAKLLNNDAAIGTLTPHTREYKDDGTRVRTPDGEPVPNYYPAAVPLPLWSAVQAMNGHRRVLAKPSRPGLVTHTLAGLAKCACCGSTMTRVWKGRTGGQPKLVCVTAKRGGNCQYRAVNVAAIDDVVLNAALGHLLADAPYVDDDIDAKLRALDAALLGIDGWAAGLTHGATAKDAASEALLRQAQRSRNELLAEKTAVEDRLSDQSEAVIASRIAELADALGAVPHDLPTVNLALKRVFARVVVDPATMSLRFVWAHKPDHETTLPYGFPAAVVPPKREKTKAVRRRRSA